MSSHVAFCVPASGSLPARHVILPVGFVGFETDMVTYWTVKNLSNGDSYQVLAAQWRALSDLLTLDHE